jgi:hypothetical protein
MRYIKKFESGSTDSILNDLEDSFIYVSDISDRFNIEEIFFEGRQFRNPQTGTLVKIKKIEDRRFFDISIGYNNKTFMEPELLTIEDISNSNNQHSIISELTSEIYKSISSIVNMEFIIGKFDMKEWTNGRDSSFICDLRIERKL